MRISLISSKLLVLVLGFSLLFANISITPVSAEINDLTVTETANIQLVIDNINELISSLEQIRDNGSSRERKIAERLIAEYVPIRANIESKLGDEIKSVPELDDGNPPRYRHGEHNGSPKGAYCGDNQAQIRNDDGTWVPCPQGTIILDSDLLDPGNGTPIDESTTEGWQDKWELADIIVHEKHHEKFIDREIQILQERAWWNNLTPEQKEQRIQEAIERATTARKHAGVFMAQKDFVSMHKKLLEEQEDELKDEKKDLESERRTLQRSDGNDVRINEINQRLEEIEQRLEDIDNQTDWLKDRRKALERTARNAVAGSHFGFEDCSWPHNHSTGNVAMVITFPAGLERIDLKVLENQITDVRITDTIWYEEYEQIESILWEPSLYVEMTEPVFSSTIFQPNVCDYIDEMLETGEIKASTEPLPIFETYMVPFTSETPSIPPWIKTNALWWSQNQIDDKTFALAIGFLVKEKIIQVDSNKIDPTGSLIVSDNLIIPSWIQNNAKWWGEEKITDNDFKQGIQFMLNEEIISFQGPQKGQINPPSFTPETGTGMEKEIKQKILQHFADTLLANNAGLRQLLEMQNFVGDSLEDFTKEAWNNYSENKNQETMESAILLEDLTRLMKEDSSKTITALKDSNENIELFFKEVKRNDFDDFVLKNNAEEKLENLDEASNVKSEKDLEDAEKNTEKIDGLIGNSIENAKQLGGIIEGEIPDVINAQSSRYSFAFEPGSIEEKPSGYYGIDSRFGAKTCTSDSVCDANKGETCSSRDPETSGKCIPTWFGICHAWAPSCLMDVYQTSKELVYSDSSYSNPIITEDPPTQDPPIEEGDTDLDNDGISNMQDACPDEPETVNEYMDSDGCPDTPPTTDTTPPVISVPSNTIIESSEELTPVTFNAISNDAVDGSITPTCNPPSGSLFPVGITTVTCTATDSAGNTTAKSFTVEVIFVDIKPPVITISSINSIESGDGFIVTYDATAEDNVDGSVEVSCNPPSGSFFPEGTHRITCIATDSAGNTATQAIDVTVTRVE